MMTRTPERGEHAGILDANHAATNHDQCFRYLRDSQNLVAVYDVPAVDGHFRIHGRFCSGGNYDEFRFQFVEPGAVLHANVVRIHERSNAVIQVDAISLQLVLQHRGFILNHARDAKIEVAHRDVFFDVIV